MYDPISAVILAVVIISGIVYSIAEKVDEREFKREQDRAHKVYLDNLPDEMKHDENGYLK